MNFKEEMFFLEIVDRNKKKNLRLKQPNDETKHEIAFFLTTSIFFSQSITIQTEKVYR